MTTSGTYAFSLNRDSLIAAALRTLEVIGAGETPSPADVTNCSEALNIMVKAMVMDGLPLWCIQELTIPLVAGQSSYVVGPSTAKPRPLRVLQAFTRSSTGNDLELQIVSRFDYNTLGLKTSTSQPNQLWHNPQVDDGTVTVYNVPFDSTFTLHLIVQRSLQDFNLSTDTPDFPQEAYQMLKWCLADEIAVEYGAKPMKMQICAGKAAAYKAAFMAFEQDQASLYFLPSGRKN